MRHRRLNRHDRILLWLCAGTLLILAAMYPDATQTAAHGATTVLLAVVEGIAQAAAQQPAAALIAAGGLYLARTWHTHRTTRAH